jgi:hypothetical protein
VQRADKIILVAILLMVILVGGKAYQTALMWWEDYQAWLVTPIAYYNGPKDASVCISSEFRTFWHIAREYYPGQHTGAMVDEIRKANPGLDPGRLQIGQEVVLP